MSEDVYQLTAQYNQVIWPLIIIFNILAILMILIVILKPGKYNKDISLVLAFESLWLGVVYWLIFSYPQDPVTSTIIGVLWILITAAFLFIGVYKDSLSFNFTKDFYSIIGLITILYALVGYPIIQMIEGHFYPAMLLLGAAPCPFTIFTFGFLLWTDKKVPIIIPLLLLIYAIPVGIFAVLLYQIWVDLALIPVGIIGFILIYHKNTRLYSE
jgi:hypothetical protein